MTSLIVAGLTDRQQAAVEAATKISPDPSWHDGILRSISAVLGNGPTFTDAEVVAAIKTVLRYKSR
jgi:hypothetical protein